MFCKKCGSEIQSGMKFCMNCGASVEIESQPNTVENNTPVVNTVPAQPVEQEVMNPSVQPAQQPVQQVQPMQPNPQNGNKKHDVIFFIAIAIIGVALISIPIVLKVMNDKDKPSTSSNSNSSTTTNTGSNSGYNSNTNTHSQYQFTNSNTSSNSGFNTNTNSNSGYNTNTNTNSNGNTKEITIQGYTFNIPSNATVELESDEAYITGLKTQNDMGFIGIIDGSYDQYKSNKALVRAQMESTGFDIGEIFINTYGGVEFIVVPVSSGGKSVVYGIAKLTDNKIIMVMVANSSYQIDYTLLDIMGTIVASAKNPNQL